ncbi:uncharacterized protein LOC105203700 [Solenopsis invicta]|uniref:uncharacterized protein LOC105203700 n=1 Tax=Solenopsis invicta TaxID=13686 RepID=UPI00193EB425|nr:uncharacterized protein LOC105203700 [Solenopsis invicta]
MCDSRATKRHHQRRTASVEQFGTRDDTIRPCCQREKTDIENKERPSRQPGFHRPFFLWGLDIRLQGSLSTNDLLLPLLDPGQPPPLSAVLDGLGQLPLSLRSFVRSVEIIHSLRLANM